MSVKDAIDAARALTNVSQDPKSTPPEVPNNRLKRTPYSSHFIRQSVEPSPKRDAQGRFISGTKGGPGRPAGFAALIREMTADGEEMVMHALAVMRGEARVPDLHWPKGDADGYVDPIPYERAPSFAEQQAARNWLADRGFGKSVERVEIASGLPELAIATLDTLEPDDARALFALTRKLSGGAFPFLERAPSSAVVDGADPAGGPSASEPADPSAGDAREGNSSADPS